MKRKALTTTKTSWRFQERRALRVLFPAHRAATRNANRQTTITQYINFHSVRTCKECSGMSNQTALIFPDTHIKSPNGDYTLGQSGIILSHTICIPRSFQNNNSKSERSLPEPHAHLGVNRRSHGDLRAATPRHRARLLDGLCEHAQGVVQRPLRFVQHVLAAERERV